MNPSSESRFQDRSPPFRCRVSQNTYSIYNITNPHYVPELYGIHSENIVTQTCHNEFQQLFSDGETTCGTGSTAIKLENKNSRKDQYNTPYRPHLGWKRKKCGIRFTKIMTLLVWDQFQGHSGRECPAREKQWLPSLKQPSHIPHSHTPAGFSFDHQGF